MTNYEIIRKCLDCTIDDFKNSKSSYVQGYRDACKNIAQLMDELDRMDQQYEELKRTMEVIK